MTSTVLFFVTIAISLCGLFSCVNSDSYKAEIARQLAQEDANKVPRVVARKDGCEVYAFNPGDRWRYFTRCGSQTTTDNNYTVHRQSGKTSITETVDDSITTENGAKQ